MSLWPEVDGVVTDVSEITDSGGVIVDFDDWESTVARDSLTVASGGCNSAFAQCVHYN